MATLESLIIELKVKGKLKSVLDLSSPSDQLNYSFAETFTDGAGAGQANQWFHDKRTLAGGANEALDLAGSLVNGLGETVTFARIKALIIRHKTQAATNMLKIGGAAANQFVNYVADASDILHVRPGGFLALVARDATGYVVTAGTGDQLKIDNTAAGSVDYEIILIGSTS